MEWRRAQREWINRSLRLACTHAITKATTPPEDDAVMERALACTHAITKATTPPAGDAMTERAPKKRRWKALALANGVALDCCTMEDVKEGHRA